MDGRDRFEELVEAGFPVVETHGKDRTSEATAVRLGESGIEVRMPADALPEKGFSWLEFTLPGDGYRVKALGEVADVNGSQHGWAFVRFLFKHVFPRDMAAMRQFLQARAAA